MTIRLQRPEKATRGDVRLSETHEREELLRPEVQHSPGSQVPQPIGLFDSGSTNPVEQDRKQALEDVGWAILNSKEFLFQH